ncbi:PREDICTED: uncharacterized protein LOC109154751 [Ipomoea nil]|uniref:uncharacterized protein LOC109154751 n=1 Tax=Ipomoea nil TaxID=35883 RepID=UPI000901B3A8|nr:PREDICTED: uncharacterized protein LOC109154751 [Ipomoea nil]
MWTQRKKKEVIGILVTVNPTEGERYYLRLLLMNVRTPKSFEHLKNVNGHQSITFREAAEKLGLLSGDHIVEKCLDEAVLYQMPSSFRRLFATLLIFCDITNPRNLWNKFKTYMCEDLLRTKIHTEEEVQLIVLQLIANAVEKMGKKIDDFNLVDNMLSLSTQEKEDREIAAEYNIQVSEYDLLCVEKLNVEQRKAFDTIMASIISNSGGVYFIDGPSGTGKTFLYKCLLATVRSKKWIALATASSGIAASILPSGRTAHSTFKIPIDGDDKYVCNIGKRTAEATLLKKYRLILWDEASMANRRIKFFGGKVVVFGGDFRQTLPVIRYGKKEDFIEASLVKSPSIWPNIQRLKLVQNVRANEDPAFCEYLMKIGNGTELFIGRDKIKIPSSFIIPCPDEDISLDALFQSVYPDLTCFWNDPYSLMSRAILTTKNEIADEINSILIDRFPGESKCYVSFDEPLNSNQLHCKDYLHTLSPAGLPPHKLLLKKNCPIILLRNLNPAEGLCNGTRLVCDSFEDHLISCFIAVGEYKGKHVFIPRIPLEPSKDENCLIPFKRTQFPTKVSFAMTINKAQGQTLDFVGIYLKEPVFSHRQLYVPMSQAKKADSVKMIIFSDDGHNKLTNITNNIVYQEILDYISQTTVAPDKN